ncbi:unnamed protein product [Boreogadus saida]
MLGPSSAAQEVAALLSDKGKGRDRVPLPCCIDTHYHHSASSTAAVLLPLESAVDDVTLTDQLSDNGPS